MSLLRDMSIGFTFTFLVLFAATLEPKEDYSYETKVLELIPLNPLHYRNNREPIMFIKDGERYTVAELEYNLDNAARVSTYTFKPTSVATKRSYRDDFGTRELIYMTTVRYYYTPIFDIPVIRIDFSRVLIDDRLNFSVSNKGKI